MKKFTFFVFATLVVSAINAQFKAGETYLTGSVSLNSDKTTSPSSPDIKSFGFEFSPAFIKFNTDKKATGFRFISGYSKSNTTFGITLQEAKQYTIGAGIFAHQYYSLGNNFYFLLEPGASFTYGSGKNVTTSVSTVTTTENKIYGVRAYLTPGIGYKLTDRFFMNLNFNNILALSYIHQDSKTTVMNNTTTSKSNSFGFQSSLNNTSVGNLGITFGWRLNK